MRAQLPKHSGAGVIALLVAAVLAWGFWPRPVLVEGVMVTRAPMAVTIEEEGRTRVVDRYVISAPVDGVACRVRLSVGDRVEKGQTLLTISPLESHVLDSRSRAQAEARVAAANSSLQAARQIVESARATAFLYDSEVKRLRAVADKGLIPRGTLDKGETDVLTAAAALRAAEHAAEVARYELEAAETALKYTAGTVSAEPVVRVPVRSPIDGRVLKIWRECEGPVRTGEALLEVGNPASLEITVDVLSADAVKIKPGTKVLFDRWGGEQTLEGVVRVVEPVGFTKISALGVEEQRVLVVADFSSPRELWQRLGDGYRVEARFVLWHDDDVLQVPASALFRYASGWAVFAVENGRAKRRKVQTGQRNGLIAQIVAGVEAGETVINHPNDEVDDDKRVALR